jgi:hypothetical protein
MYECSSGMSASRSSGAGGEAISDGKERGEGGGREVVEPRMLGGVDIGLEGGEVERRRLVRREAKKAEMKSVLLLTLTLM